MNKVVGDIVIHNGRPGDHIYPPRCCDLVVDPRRDRRDLMH